MQLDKGTGKRQPNTGACGMHLVDPPAGLLTDGDGAVGFVEVAPLERDQLALSQSADQFQIEHRQALRRSAAFRYALMWSG